MFNLKKQAQSSITTYGNKPTICTSLNTKSKAQQNRVAFFFSAHQPRGRAHVPRVVCQMTRYQHPTVSLYILCNLCGGARKQIPFPEIHRDLPKEEPRSRREKQEKPAYAGKSWEQSTDKRPLSGENRTRPSTVFFTCRCPVLAMDMQASNSLCENPSHLEICRALFSYLHLD